VVASRPLSIVGHELMSAQHSHDEGEAENIAESTVVAPHSSMVRSTLMAPADDHLQPDPIVLCVAAVRGRGQRVRCRRTCTCCGTRYAGAFLARAVGAKGCPAAIVLGNASQGGYLGGVTSHRIATAGGSGGGCRPWSGLTSGLTGARSDGLAWRPDRPDVDR
jgi:hypothetical protein